MRDFKEILESVGYSQVCYEHYRFGYKYFAFNNGKCKVFYDKNDAIEFCDEFSKAEEITEEFFKDQHEKYMVAVNIIKEEMMKELNIPRHLFDYLYDNSKMLVCTCNISHQEMLENMKKELYKLIKLFNINKDYFNGE